MPVPALVELGKNDKRSRQGCQECRERHRKCDETKPACMLCQAGRRKCTYGLKLSWGGKPFSKSTFGACMTADTPVKRVGAASGKSSFVYTVLHAKDLRTKGAMTEESSTIEHTESAEEGISRNDSGSETVSISDAAAGAALTAFPVSIPSLMQPELERPVQISQPVNWLQLPAPYKKLLDYFINAVSSFSCHASVRTEFCSFLIPMALETSPLLAAILHLAAVHRKTAGLEQSTSRLAHLQGTAVKQLRETLANLNNDTPDNAIVATTLTLCTGELASGVVGNLWRLHLDGTASLYRKRYHKENAVIGSGGQLLLGNTARTSESFVFRWFASLVVLGSLSGKSSNSLTSTLDMVLVCLPEDHAIDVFCGFSPKLLSTFAKIGLMIASRDSDKNNSESTTSLAANGLPSLHMWNCLQVADDIHTGMRYSSTRNIMQPNSAQFGPMSSELESDFFTLSKAYHNAALLHLYRRVLKIPSSSGVVQDLVKDTLTLVASLHMLHEPCPAIAQLFPLFSAGCEVNDPADRQHVTVLLESMREFYKLLNVQQALEFLLEFWAYRDRNMDEEGHLQWDQFLLQMGFDLILY